MQAVTVKAHWVSLHPKLRMDPEFWVSVCAKLHSDGVVVEDATDEQVKQAIVHVEMQERFDLRREQEVTQ